MTLTADRLTLAELAPILRDVVKDKSYRASEVGQLVGRYIRWFRNEWGATDATIRDYEAILARMSLTLADKLVLEVDVEDLRDVIDLWAHREPNTRRKVTSVVRAFWAWAENEGIVPFSPAQRLRRPRAPKPVVQLLPDAIDARLLGAANVTRDRVAILCLLDLGVRRGGLAGLRVRDFDLARRTVVVTEKGRKGRKLPLRGRIVQELEAYLLDELPALDRQPELDDFLLYPIRRFGKDGKVARAFPKKKPSEQSVHRWWYRMLEQAGYVSEGMTSGLNMHRARHTFAVEMRRAAGIEAAQHALGHRHLSTTEGVYGHWDFTDTEDSFDKLQDVRRASVPPQQDEEAHG